MRKIYIILLLVSITSVAATAQEPAKLDQNSVVKDSLGNTIPFAIWNQLMLTGRYKLKNEKKENTEFIIIRISDEEFKKNLETAPKPKESNFFRTGSKFDHFKTTDISGNKINTKSLAGKIIVLNYWFIKCPPCIREMPELNHLVETYKSDSSIVFIAVALDRKDELEKFLRHTRFDYAVIDEGRFIADQNRITTFPTNVIIDQKGKIYFHSSGLAMNTAYWIKKSIEELRGNSTNKIASIQAQR